MLSFRPDVLVAFGDSLSDAGTIAGLSNQLLPFEFPFNDRLIDPAYAGVWSNGPVHTQLLPDLLGAESIVYAAGAARALGSSELRDSLGFATLLIKPGLDSDLRKELLDFNLNFGGQVLRFLQDKPVFPNGPEPDFAPRDDVVGTIFIGLNDVSDLAGGFDVDDPDDLAAALALPADLAERVEGMAIQLAESGKLDALVIYTPPPIDFFPIGAQPEAGVAVFNTLLASYADALVGVAERIESDHGLETDIVDLSLITAQIDADPQAFSLLAKGPFYEGDGTSPNFEGFDISTGLPKVSFDVNAAVEDIPLRQIQFFDEKHFSAATHGIVAAYGAAALTSEVRAFGNGPNSVRGSGAADLLLSAGGKDTVRALSGNDVVLGGRGNDTLLGQAGRDILSGGAGKDDLNGGLRDDLLAGGTGNDVISGGRGRDIISDGPGNDKVSGEAGNDTFIWVDSAVRGFGGSRSDLFKGGAGSDTLYLITTEDQVAAVEAEMAARTTAQADLNNWAFPSIGVTARGVETVVVLSGGLDQLDDVSTPNGALLAEGLLWGIV